MAPFCPRCCQAVGSKVSYPVFHAATDKAMTSQSRMLGGQSFTSSGP